MLLTYTEEDQINIGFLAESSTGKSYIPLELSEYFPEEDVIKLGYASPTAFFHEYGILMWKEGLPVDWSMKPTKTKVKEDLEFEKGVTPSKEEVEAEYQKRKREWNEMLRESYYLINLERKILIFLDMPHDQLLQRLRSLLSHDEKEISFKITDKRDKSGLRTKNVVVRGYPTVIFCSAKFSLADQEKTRLLILSPEISQEKLRESIALRIERESDRDAFLRMLEENPERKMLKERVRIIKDANIKNIIIPEDLRSFIYEHFLKDHPYLLPRHQRDISRLLALIKAHTLLNFMHRERIGHNIIAEMEDVEAGFRLYYEVSEANEFGLSPELWNIYKNIEPHISEQGITRKDFQQIYFKVFHKPIGRDRASEIIGILASCGLLIEDVDPEDKRKKRYYLTEKILPPTQDAYIFTEPAKTQNETEKEESLIVLNQEEENVKLSIVQNLKSVFWVEGAFGFHTCGACGFSKLTSWKAETFKGQLFWICEDCKEKWEKQIREVEKT